jgi:hypothetical protein
MQIRTYVRQLHAAQKEVLKQTKIVQEISAKVAKAIKAHAKENSTSIADIATRSGVAYSTLVNWVWGNGTHLLPASQVMSIWNAASAVPGQKRSFSYLLRQMTDKEWSAPNKEIARRIRCSANQVALIRRELGK